MNMTEYECRRQRLAEAAVEVIARDGIDAATVRRIAAELQCSTTIITDCFDDKDELLLTAYRTVAGKTLERFRQRISTSPADLIDALMSLTALDPESWRGWRVHLAFLERALRDPRLAEEQQCRIDETRGYIEQAIRLAYGSHGDAGELARLVIVLIRGISLQLLFEPGSWTRDQVRSLLASQISAALGRGTTGGRPSADVAGAPPARPGAAHRARTSEPLQS